MSGQLLVRWRPFFSPDMPLFDDHDSPVWAAMVDAFARRGVRVRVVPHTNELRRLSAPKKGFVAEVRVEGFANLVHEFVHLLLTRSVDDDYGIDYHAIPYPLEHGWARALLWEELACCVVSCAYVARRGATQTQVELDIDVDAWFREQLETQPVFYGMQDDPGAFVRRVASLAARYRRAADSTVALAYQLCEAALIEAGAPANAARPLVAPTLFDLLARQSDAHGEAA